ncbi:MAG: hypothetical protein U0670_18450 [Anaerolineae bacterium]
MPSICIPGRATASLKWPISLIAQPDDIAPFLVTMKDAHVRALCEILYEAGVQRIDDAHQPTLLVVWNNREDSDIRYRYGEAFLRFGGVGNPRFEHGPAPRFAAIAPDVQIWTHGSANEHIQQTQWQLQLDYHGIASVALAQRDETAP